MITSKKIIGNYLEVGGGNGQFAQALLKSSTNEIKSLTVLDLIDTVGTLIEDRFRAKVKLLPNTNINQLHPNSRYECITLVDVVHHLPEDQVESMLNSLICLLNSQGHLFIKEIQPRTFNAVVAWIADTVISQDRPKKFWSSNELASTLFGLEIGQLEVESVTKLKKQNYLISVQKK